MKIERSCIFPFLKVMLFLNLHRKKFAGWGTTKKLLRSDDLVSSELARLQSVMMEYRLQSKSSLEQRLINVGGAPESLIKMRLVRSHEKLYRAKDAHL